jgi:adenosylcobinamide-GDP ribazoletransferase
VSHFLASVVRALRFWSRLPLPVLPVETDPHAPPAMAALATAVPVAGLLIGALPALVIVLSNWCGLPAMVSAILATTILVGATGAMHEDALGDVADGFGGGKGVEDKLAIMKDPRLGTYGMTALLLALSLRISLYAGLLMALGPWRASAILLAAAAFSRVCGLWPLVALPPARPSGLGSMGATLDRAGWLPGAAVGAVVAAALGLAAGAGASAFLSPAAAFAAAWGMARLARRQIGGQTGDVCGAATLLAELAALLVGLAAFAD